MRTGILLLPLLGTGCDRLTAVDELTVPVVAQGIYLGVDVPSGYSSQLAGADSYLAGAICNVFLANVTDPSDIADAPVTGARLQLRSPANGRLTFREVPDEPGKYTLDVTDGLVYEPGDAPVIEFEHDGEAASLEVLAPEAPDIDLPGSQSSGRGLDVALTDYRFENAIGASYDVERGKLWWDNLPDGVDEVYDFTHAEGAVEQLVIPPEAFPRVGTYVVGVAGMEIADPVSFTGVNTTLSAFLAGRLTLNLVSVE